MIPLTVIGGFLGAGKTTLINFLLRTATERLGVLVNDFGAINIDAALIQARDGDLVALTNGCVCCEIGGDLGGGLARLTSVDHVIVEASGVSDPWRVAQLALVEPGFHLEPIVVLVDGLSIATQLADRWVADTVRGQLAAAELIVLNKADTDVILPAHVPVIKTLFGAVPMAALRFPVPPRSRFRGDIPSAEKFRSLLVTPSGPFDRGRLRACLTALPRSVLRVKGFCRLGATAEPHLLQFASGQWSLTPSASQPPGLVVIGTPDMPEDADVRDLFNSLR